MNHREHLQAAEAFVKERLAGDSSGHDWWHIERVRQVALAIGREERVDLYIVELAALLHDVADWKFAGGDSSAGPREVRAWLDSRGIEAAVSEHVCQIIEQLSFKGAGVATPMSTVEGKVVQDADRLDAIGAVGIARAFAYGGAKGRALHDPSEPPQMHASFAAYKQNAGPTLNHFYEKLMLLKDRMNTAAGKRLAAERQQFMQAFLDQFLSEWDGQR
jgi:uncharacterized protein